MAAVSLKLKPFTVPETVTIDMPPGRKQDGLQPLPTLRIEDLEPAVLDALIEEFVATLYKQAGRE